MMPDEGVVNEWIDVEHDEHDEHDEHEHDDVNHLNSSLTGGSGQEGWWTIGSGENHKRSNLFSWGGITVVKQQLVAQLDYRLFHHSKNREI